ncbi:hypothetical protein, partial [Bacteriovorax sp. DB6_IX]|uniref:hypothetical protein n=1 Tax=Bacteriovorax sp. DB6_IX TaxID=1353530 RepID=UPI00038A0873
MKKLLPVTLAVTTLNIAHALPIDWHGEFQFDTNRIEEFRRIDSTTDSSSSTAGSQELPLGSGGKSNASYQTYVFKLIPEIVVNDSTTLTAVLTSGYGYGGTWGDSADKNKGTGTAENPNALYSHSTVSDNNINLTQAYATFYADTATYTLGRFATEWALGAIHNAGNDMNSRHATIRDGIKLDFKIGNFKISPYIAKISSGNTLTKTTRIKESGVSLLYNNLDQEMSFGILYAKNKASNFASLEADIDGDTLNTSLGKTDVKITDLYFKKSFGKFTTEIEVPFTDGEIGKLYSTTTSAKYKAKAFLFHNTYAYNNNHTFKFNVGKVSGDAGNTSSYEALYLHPNYQIANLLFRYNLNAVSDSSNNSIYDSYVTNTFFFKLSHTYEAGKWNWTNSVIWAKAEETAKAGTQSYDHDSNRIFTANFDQKDDLGIEIDSDFTYKWNTSVTLGGSIGYLMT